jgi:hypothetical protein
MRGDKNTNHSPLGVWKLLFLSASSGGARLPVPTASHFVK